MFRVLVIIGAFLFFRAVLPRRSRLSPTSVTPYMNALNGMMTAQQMSSILDEVMPYEAWLASRKTKTHTHSQDETGKT